MTTPTPGSFRPHLDSAVSDLALQVDRDTVLQARDALLAEAEDLRAQVDHARHGRATERCGDDPVSHDAQRAFEERIHALLDGCVRYCDELAAAARALDDTARGYGYTEEQITAGLGGRR